MIKKNSVFKCRHIEKEAFDSIKQAITNALTLNTPNFSNHFILYIVASDSSYAAVLTQINDQNLEAPISFYSSNLQGAELNYSEVEKQAFFVFKAIKHFRPFLLKAQPKVIVPFLAVRQLPVQRELGEKRENWVTTLQEYDLDIRPANIVKCQGFCRLLAGDSNIQEHEGNAKTCQTVSRRQRKPGFPSQPVNIEQPFEQWGLDIIGEIIPHSSEKHRYILIATDYFTKWVEAIPLKAANSEAIIEFIDQFIITRFGVPNTLIFYNASYFSSNSILEFVIKRGFKLKYSANYYPQGNGLAKSTNKNLIQLIKRTIDQDHKNWHKSLIFALWANRITQKALIGTSPFNLVYGKEVVILANLVLPSLALVQFIEENPSSSIQLRHNQILKLEEEREKARTTHAKNQQIIKYSFDTTSTGPKLLQVGDLVLKWDKAHEDKGKHTKFQKMWLIPFQIIEKIGPLTFILQDLSRKRDSLPVNGLILKKFFT
eukprot:PITA_28971